MKLTKSKLQQIIQEEVTKIVSSDAILEMEQFEISSAGEGEGQAPGSWSGNRDGVGLAHPADRGRTLADLVGDLGTLDNVLQVLKLVAKEDPTFITLDKVLQVLPTPEENPKFLGRFQHYFDIIID
tara:strand:- start:63 stop:440 length:378 start_codon:yes stop_codon:yes gene_type:complete